MRYVCDAGDLTWFRIETVGEAAQEGQAMKHAVERYFREAYDDAASSYVPAKGLRVSEQNIGLKDHIQLAMPIFLTLRDREGNALVTAMLPPVGEDETSFRPILVGPANSDPYRAHAKAIDVLADHFGYDLQPDRCYPYKRG
jgi:hypothetical protein